MSQEARHLAPIGILDPAMILSPFPRRRAAYAGPVTGWFLLSRLSTFPDI